MEHLTDDAIKEIRIAGEYPDGKEGGLILCVGKHGKNKRWRIRCRQYLPSGKTKMLNKVFALYNDMPVAMARTEARAIKAAAKGGQNRIEDNKNRADKNTFGYIAKQVIELFNPNSGHEFSLSEDSYKKYSQFYKEYWKPLHHRIMLEITYKEIRELKKEIATPKQCQNGKVFTMKAQANNAIKYLAVVFDRAYREGLCGEANGQGQMFNPAVGHVQWDAPAKDGSAITTPEQFQLFFKHVEDLPIAYCNFLKLCVLTGIRSESLRGIRWEWITWDGDEANFTIPADKMKQNKKRKPLPFKMPLTPQVKAILLDQKAYVDAMPNKAARASGWVFPASRNNKSSKVYPYLAKNGRLEQKLSKAMGFHFSPHTGRRTVQTTMEDDRIFDFVRGKNIDACLHHAHAGMDKHYNKYRYYAQMLRLFTQYHEYIEKIIGRELRIERSPEATATEVIRVARLRGNIKCKSGLSRAKQKHLKDRQVALVLNQETDWSYRRIAKEINRSDKWVRDVLAGVWPAWASDEVKRGIAC